MESESTTQLQTPGGEKKQVRLVDIPLNTQQDALQLIVPFYTWLKSVVLLLWMNQLSYGNVLRCFNNK